jgi:hypothetical protein
MVQEAGVMEAVGAIFTVTEAAFEVTITGTVALSVTCNSKFHVPVVVDPEVMKL